MKCLSIPEVDKDVLVGVWDLHVHSKPCYYPRPFDELELSRDGREVGMGGMLFKNHFMSTVDRCYYVRKAVPGFEACGCPVLNYYQGGLSPYVVEAQINLGAKAILMPTVHAANHVKVLGAPTYTWAGVKGGDKVAYKPKKFEGITILTPEGELKPEALEIFDLIADADIALATVHLGLDEIHALIKGATKAGIKKIVVSHAGEDTSPWTIAQQMEMVEMGGGAVYIELTQAMSYYYMLEEEEPLPGMGTLSWTVKAMKTVGADHIIMTSDQGTLGNPHPIDAMRMFIYHMKIRGISDREIDKMTKDNPARLMGF